MCLRIILLRPSSLLEKREVPSVTNAKLILYIGLKMAARFRVRGMILTSGEGQ